MVVVGHDLDPHGHTLHLPSCDLDIFHGLDFDLLRGLDLHLLSHDLEFCAHVINLVLVVFCSRPQPSSWLLDVYLNLL